MEATISIQGIRAKGTFFNISGLAEQFETLDIYDSYNGTMRIVTGRSQRKKIRSV